MAAKDILIDNILEKPLNIKKGTNKLLIKAAVCTDKPYSGREFGFNMRFLDKDKKLEKELLYGSY